jgi:hypothetical protein
LRWRPANRYVSIRLASVGRVIRVTRDSASSTAFSRRIHFEPRFRPFSRRPAALLVRPARSANCDPPADVSGARQLLAPAQSREHQRARLRRRAPITAMELRPSDARLARVDVLR